MPFIIVKSTRKRDYYYGPYASVIEATLDAAELMALEKKPKTFTVAMIEPYQTVKTLISKGKERYGKP